MKCDKCEANAVFSRKYSGEKLCSKCFSNSILRKTIKTISKYKMIKAKDIVAVAVSGGKDSLTLLNIMNKISQNHNFEIKAITIDEGIEGYRDEALKMVHDFCATLGIKHDVFSYKELFDLTLDESLNLRENEKISSCSICGTFRRRAIDYAATQVNANVIATGHNLDDMVQSFLINMGSGDTNKIGWMNPENENSLKKIKPFCEIYESEIVFYAFNNGIPFQTEPCPHMNEGIRTEFREFLNSLENHHAGIKNNFYKSILKLSQIVKDSNYKQKRMCLKCGNECTGKICSVCNLVLKLKENQT